MARTAEQIVRDFGKLWERRDIEGIVHAMTPDCVYQNVPVPAMHGHDAVRKFITPNLTKSVEVTWEYLNVATSADGKQVFTERVDTFVFKTGRVPIPVMGIFVLRGNKIHEWRDYSDIATFVRDMQAIGQMPGPGIT